MKKFFIFFILSSCYESRYFENVVFKEGFFKSKFEKFEDEKIISKLKSKIEKNPYIFKKILNILSLKKKDQTDFKYFFSSISEDKKKIILVYFLKLEDPVYQGIRVEFVYNTENKNFEIVYYRKVPYD